MLLSASRPLVYDGATYLVGVAIVCPCVCLRWFIPTSPMLLVWARCNKSAACATGMHCHRVVFGVGQAMVVDPGIRCSVVPGGTLMCYERGLVRPVATAGLEGAAVAMWSCLSAGPASEAPAAGVARETLI